MSFKDQKQREIRKREQRMNRVFIPGKSNWDVIAEDSGDEYPVASTAVGPNAVATRVFCGTSRLQSAAVKIAAALIGRLDLSLFFEPDPEASKEDLMAARQLELNKIAGLSVSIADHVLQQAKRVDIMRVRAMQEAQAQDQASANGKLVVG